MSNGGWTSSTSGAAGGRRLPRASLDAAGRLCPALQPDAGGRGGPRSPRQPDEDVEKRGRLARRSRRARRGTAADARTPPHSQRGRRVTAAARLPARGGGRTRAAPRAGWMDWGAVSRRDGWMDGLGIFFFYLTGGPNQNRRWIHFGWLRSTECHIVTCLRNVTEAESAWLCTTEH